MRQITHGDLCTAARAILSVQPAARDAALQRMLEQAQAADAYRARFGRAHPRWGNGSLMGVACQLPLPAEPFLSNPEYLDCLARVLAMLRRRRGACGNRLSRHVGFDYARNPRARAMGGMMAEKRAKIAAVDPVWTRICDEARKAVHDEPLLGGLIHSGLLHHASFERALAYRFSLKLASGEMSEQILREFADEAYADEPDLGQAARADLVAVHDRDPACHRYVQPVLFFKGFQALQAYRVGHWLWRKGRHDMAYFVQMRTSEAFGVDIHPAARIGRGLMIDHAHSIVIGETAVVGDNVSMLHSVTLGGTGKQEQDRHPKIGNGVLIGAGAKVLGNIRVGDNSRIAAGSVVLEDVPECKTVAGVPAHIVGEAGCEHPATEMDQLIRE
jgi:serine O-acetyltransferase